MQPKADEVKAMTPEQFEAALREARAGAKKILERSGAAIVLDHPFFASTKLKKPFTEDLSVPTLCVTPRGHVYYNPFFVASMSVNNQVFNTCHEVLHYMSGHSDRYMGYIRSHGLPDNGENRSLWNQAGDYWINDTLVRANVGEQTPGTLCRPGSADKTVEQIMDELRQEEEQNGGKKGKQKGQGKGDPGQGDGDPLAGDMKDEDMSDGERAEIEAERKLDVAEAAQVAKAKGKLPGILSAFAADTIETRTPWYDILERYMTERVKTDYSWARPNRRYAPEFYLPQIDGIGSMGPIVIQVDISGSVSQQEIKHYNGHLKGIVEQCRPSKVHVVYTDTRVQKHEEFDKPEDVEIKFYSGGGTDMRAGFDFVDKLGIEAEVMVTLTDGYTPFPEDTTIPSIWCISNDTIKSPCGETIPFKLEA